MRALDVAQAWLALGADVFDADGARFVRDRRFPGLPGCNFVSHVTAASPAAIERLLERVGQEFAGLPFRQFQVDARTPPPFEARLVLDGYRREDALILVLDGPLRGDAPVHDVRPIADGDGWRAWEALNVIDWREYRERTAATEDLAHGAAVAASRRAKCPPVRYWLAYDGGTPAGFFSAWEGIGGAGIVENLYVRAECRRRGFATALVHACVADARARGAGPVVIVTDPADWPKRFYASLGFRPCAVKSAYLLK